MRAVLCTIFSTWVKALQPSSSKGCRGFFVISYLFIIWNQFLYIPPRAICEEKVPPYKHTPYGNILCGVSSGYIYFLRYVSSGYHLYLRPLLKLGRGETPPAIINPEKPRNHGIKSSSSDRHR